MSMSSTRCSPLFGCLLFSNRPRSESVCGASHSFSSIHLYVCAYLALRLCPFDTSARTTPHAGVQGSGAALQRMRVRRRGLAAGGRYDHEPTSSVYAPLSPVEATHATTLDAVVANRAGFAILGVSTGLQGTSSRESGNRSRSTGLLWSQGGIERSA